MDKITFLTIYDTTSKKLYEYLDTFKDITFLTIHEITFKNLSELLIELNNLIQKSESNDKISEILLNIVTIFNNYIDNININNYSIIIKQLYELYIQKIKGLSIESKDIILTTLTRNIHGIILINIEYVIDTISNICTDEIITSSKGITDSPPSSENLFCPTNFVCKNDSNASALFNLRKILSCSSLGVTGAPTSIRS